jgi:Aspartyl protease
MLLRGKWQICDDGVVRPVIRGHVEAGDGSWKEVPFLLDTGADRTAFSADVLAALGLQAPGDPGVLGGLGGYVAAVVVETRIRFPRDDGVTVTFRGRYAAVTALEALDMSVLGRDITDNFALIVDRPGDLVCLLGQKHRYVIEQS